MAAWQKLKRRLVRGLVWLTAVGILLLALLPVWFPWVLTPALNRYGLGFAHYDRIGWSRFALTGVHGSWGGTTLDAQRVESVLPAKWLWRRFDGRTNGPPLLSINNGHLTIGGLTTNAIIASSAERQGSTVGTLNQISQIGLKLQRLLPVAGMTNCTIQVASNLVSIQRADWRAGRLHVLAGMPSSRGPVELAAQMDVNMALTLAAVLDGHDASLSGGFSHTAQGWRWNGELGWLTNRADVTAQFTTNGWWPAQARVDCRRWRIPTALLQVQGYENLIASLAVNLVSNRFDLQATGLAQPSDTSARSGWPAVSISLVADGDPNRVNLHALNIQSPWLKAGLTNTVGITWTGELLAEPAQLRVSVDLDKLPGATITGQAEGVVRIEPRGGRPPIALFRFAADQVRAGQLNAKAVLVRGEFATPILKLDEIRAAFTDGSMLTADGSFDGARRIAEGRWKISGDLLKKLLPGLSYAELAASGELHGSLTNLAHHGEATFSKLRATGLKPFDVKAIWSGQNEHLESAEVEWAAGKSVLSLGGVSDLNVPERKVAATLSRLSLHRGKEELYALQQPCTLTFRAGNTNAPAVLWTLAVDAFNWRGERHTMSGTANVAWPSHGEAVLTMTNVAFVDFSDFLEPNVPNILVSELAATAHWSNGPVQSVITAAGSMTNDTGRVFGLRGTVRSDEVLSIEQLAIGKDNKPALSVTGTVPIKIIPERREGFVVWDKSQTIALAGDWKDAQSEAFSIPLGTRGQLDVSRPELRFRISGALDAPSAELTAGAAMLTWPSKTTNAPRPKLEDAQLAVEIRPDTIRLKTFAAKLDGQPITATGEWPLPGSAWRELWSTKKLPEWNQAQGHLELREARMAALSAYLPQMLSPEGMLSATLDLKAGKRFEGVLSLTNAATRSMGTLTSLRDITASVRFDGHRAEIRDFRGQIGGQPIRVDGFVTIPELDGTGLDYQVNLHGTNVPLARAAELLLRGDFALSLRGGGSLPPLLSGAITLRDGLYLQHASALVWSAPKRPEWRPPYFSVTNKPFADWKLDLAISGDRFLRVRTPVFSSIVSANFQLKGTLIAPLLTGDVRVNSGSLIFPFGALTMDQGLASFSGNDPRGPDLQINASGRNYRYDIRLEVKGQADGANVIFSSTPPLTSEQILLMLTAGEVPQSDYVFSNSARAGRLVTFLGKDLLSRYIGSDPSKERLTIQTGESFTEAGKLTYSVEYRLTDRWSIIGEYDEFNAFNTDLKWKVFTR